MARHWRRQATAQIHRYVTAPIHRDHVDRLNRSQALANTWFTYDTTKLTDGAGAQYHRILGVYAMSRALGARYLHTPIARLDYTGLPTPGRLPAEAVIDHFETLAALPSEAAPLDASIVPIETLDATRLKTPGDRPTIFRITLPHQELDLNPIHWNWLRPALKPVPRRKSGPLRIALHVRRGDLHHVDQRRIIPNGYYLQVAERLAALALEHCAEVQFELYSETLPPGSKIAKTEFFPGTQRDDVRIDQDLDGFAEFEVLPSLKKYLNLNIADTIDQLVSADVLVMSKSSLSMVAALLNPDRPIIYSPFWHSPAPGWTVASADGSFDGSRVTSRLRSLHP